MTQGGQPVFAFRFDIDTITCMTDGLSGVLDVAREHDVKFTFFANMGRAIDRKHLIGRLAGQAVDPQPSAASLGRVRKLGFKGVLDTLFRNPQLSRHAELLVKARDEGHEIGIHGGKNHQTWAERAKTWTPDEVAHEVVWSMLEYSRVLNQRPRGFSSPEWVHPSPLGEVLRNHGFEYCADARPGAAEAPRQLGVRSVTTDVLGEPGGVAVLEHLTAIGLDVEGAADEFERRVREAQSPVAYDHPSFAGLAGQPLLREVVRRLVGDGRRFVVLSEIAQ